MTKGAKQQKSSRDRRAIRKWLVSVEGGGDGDTVLCAFGCGAVLTATTLTIDHYPIARWQGGTMRRDNVRAACMDCNHEDGKVQAIRGMEARMNGYRDTHIVTDTKAIGALNELVGRIRKRPMIGLCQKLAVVSGVERRCGKHAHHVVDGELGYARGMFLCPEHLKKDAKEIRTELGG